MGSFDEVLYFGVGELKAVMLAHTIILGIAVWRYFVGPWWRGGSAAEVGRASDVDGAGPGRWGDKR